MNSDATNARRYRGASPDDRRAQRREQLIAAAIQVYGECGYRHSSVKAVCSAAGLTERYFYESFANSDELLVACYNHVTSALRHELTRAAQAAGRSRAERARAMLQAYFAALKREPRHAVVFLVEIRGISQEVDKAIDEALRAIGQDVARAMAPSGGVREQDELLQAGILGGVMHIALRWIGNGYEPPVDRVVDAALRLTLG